MSRGSSGGDRGVCDFGWAGRAAHAMGDRVAGKVRRVSEGSVAWPSRKWPFAKSGCNCVHSLASAAALSAHSLPALPSSELSSVAPPSPPEDESFRKAALRLLRMRWRTDGGATSSAAE